jgi:diguanylate cyclase (GGDEF)-like protein/PAS domain S-box-containing protein
VNPADPVAVNDVNERFRIALESSRMTVFEWNIGADHIQVDGPGLGPAGQLFRDKLTSSRQVAAMLHPDDLEMLRVQTVQALKDSSGDHGDLRHAEARFSDGAGGWLWIDIVARIIERDGEGCARRMIGTLSDISARKLAEKQFEHLRYAYSTLTATSQAIVRTPDEAQLFPEICRIAVECGGFRMALIAVLNEEGRFSALAFHGAPRSYLERLKQSSIAAAPDPLTPAARALTEGEPSICNRLSDVSGSVPWAIAARDAGFKAIAVFPIARGGKTFGVLGLGSSDPDCFDQAYVDLFREMCSDISFALDNLDHDRERRRVESALAQSEAQQRAITDAALDAIVSLDGDGAIIRFNPAAEHTFGLAMRHVLGKRFADILVPLRMRRDYIEKVKAVQREPGRASHRTRMLLLRHDGSEFRAEIALTSTDFGESLVSTLHVRDISDLERHEQLLRENALRYRELVDRSPEPVLVHRSGALLLVNAACMKLLGAQVEEQLLTRTVADFIRPDHLAQFYELANRADSVAGRDSHFLEQSWIALDGSERIVEVAGSSLDYGGTPAMQVVLRDVTDRKRAEALQSGQNHVLSMIAQASELSAIVDTLCSFVETQAPRCRCTMHLIDGSSPERMTLLAANSFSERFREKEATVLLSDDEGVCGVAAYRCAPVIITDIATDPLTRNLAAFASEEGIGAAASWPVMGRKGQLLGTLCLYYDHPASPTDDELALVALSSDLAGIAIESRLAEERIRFLAHYDELTGLPNRVLFNQMLETALARAKRHGYKLAAFFLDLDRFKNINDTFGHSVGDQVLREIAGRFKNAVRATDQLARMGGDEFFFLIDEIEGPESVTDVTRRVLEEASRPFFVGTEECQLSASIGVSVYPDDGEDTATLLKNSDIAMYRAKALGKNNFQFYSAIKNTHTVARLALESRLRRALENQEFVLHYQPRVRLTDGQVTGVEALVRWQHPERGLISPLEFIPVAEETGLIIELGHQVLAIAIRDARRLREIVDPLVRIAVNLSARQLDHPSLVRDISALLAEHAVDARQIELEITETTLIHHPEHAARVISELHDMGLGISLDDFGTGYSSLTYLKRFPLEAVKIDRSFITELPHDVNDLAIAEAIIAMAHALGLKVVAEGVETTEQMNSLMRLGCDEYQGFLFSRAVPFDRLVEVFEESASRLRALA